MGLFSRFSKKGRGIPPNASFRITQEGREKLQEFGGDPKDRVLMALETRGTSTITELAQTTGMNKGQIERLIPGLAPVYVQFVGAGNEAGEDSEE